MQRECIGSLTRRRRTGLLFGPSRPSLKGIDVFAGTRDVEASGCVVASNIGIGAACGDGILECILFHGDGGHAADAAAGALSLCTFVADLRGVCDAQAASAAGSSDLTDGVAHNEIMSGRMPAAAMTVYVQTWMA